MATLYHHPLCPHSRFVRIALGEFGMEPDLVEERAFERRPDFLMLNPAGQTPVLVEPGITAIPGASIISEYLDETRGLALGERRLLPEDPAERVEVRRLVDWFHVKFFAEVSNWLVTEKVYKRFMPTELGGGAPDMDAVRAARSNIRYHLRYIGWLAGRRNWLAGDRLSYADLAAAAHLSSVDFLGDVPWTEDDAAKAWYARVKSRPSFRALLMDRVPGITPEPGLRRPGLLKRDAARAATLEARLRARATEIGFDICRIAAPDPAPQTSARLQAWLDSGAHGDMHWMAETAERRADPRALWPDVASVVVLGTNYGPSRDPLAVLEQTSAGAISVYAQHRDYHDVIKGRLKTLAGWLAREAPADVKVFVDTAPVMEKPLAAAAGLGWQGKHTNLVSRAFGSWLFLGSIFTTLRLAPDAPEIDHCGSCSACLDICPTKAFPSPYRLDARRCISYLTIEHKGTIPAEFRPLMGNRIYGCDDCLAVCPWNKFAQATREMKLAARADLAAPSLAALAALDDAAFRAFFSGSPVKRIGRDRFVRNVMIAIGNSGDAALRNAVESALQDGSAPVRAMAVWAASRLFADRAFEALAQRYSAGETEPDVLAEWRAASASREALA